ncbi:hypothetical protein N431DRAFT_95734 [Stipitochalara longipes BDJ]|nr:hypothetical protein N431DRAFT_95734 [Stipitochalara longipes BDJ]
MTLLWSGYLMLGLGLYMTSLKLCEFRRSKRVPLWFPRLATVSISQLILSRATNQGLPTRSLISPPTILNLCGMSRRNSETSREFLLEKFFRYSLQTD